MNLNILLDAEIALLRDTIRQGLQDGHWDLKVGEKVYLKTDDRLSLPESIFY